MLKRNSAGTGAAGVYAVCAELGQLGWSSSPTYGNTKRTDVLAEVGDNLAASIQVKTKSEHSKDFQPNVQEYSPAGANEWAILVALANGEKADFYIMPRDHLAATVRAFRIAIPDSRVFLGPQEFSRYLGQWDLLRKPSSEVKWRGEDWVLDFVTTEGWPSKRGRFPFTKNLKRKR